jgi:uncharacterized membrane protein YccF (DUF307 family)
MSTQNQTTYVQTEKGPGCLVRGLYFIFVGSWLGLIWMLLAWLLNITVIGLSLGLAMLNAIPQVMTLRPRRVQTIVTTTEDGKTVVKEQKVHQVFFLIRVLYFILIGFWFSLLWMMTAWGIAGITLGLGLPVAFWMFDRVPAVTTLARN